jgi:hypothetical protein
VTRLPNFLHIGPGKSGSSWLHETLALHPEVYLSEAKDLYFFSRYYDRGLDCAFSAYLQRRKHGLTATFREDLETSDLIEEGRYATQLQRYLDYFDRQALHVAGLRRPVRRPAGLPRRRHHLAADRPPDPDPGTARHQAACQRCTVAAAGHLRQACRGRGPQAQWRRRRRPGQTVCACPAGAVRAAGRQPAGNAARRRRLRPRASRG